jgi:hypothetical protein
MSRNYSISCGTNAPNLIGVMRISLWVSMKACRGRSSELPPCLPLWAPEGYCKRLVLLRNEQSRKHGSQILTSSVA